MKLLHYIKGDRSGREARDIEMESMRDRFLADAVMGYGLYSSGGAGQARTIVALEKEVIKRSFVRKRSTVIRILAVVIFLLAVAAILWVWRGDRIGGAVTRQRTESVPVSGKDAAAVTESTETVRTDVPDGDIATDPETVSGQGSVNGADNETLPVSLPVDSVPAEKVPVPVPTAVADDTPAEVSGDRTVFSILPPDPYDAASLPAGEKYLSRPRIGMKKFNEYLLRSRILPQDGSRGEVTVSFRVNDHGRPSQIRIEESFLQEAGREAIRLLENGPEWTPAQERVKVTVVF